MTGNPVCPIHERQELVNYPEDEIRQWECPVCGWMATSEFMEKMTPELMMQIKKSYDDTKRFYRESSAQHIKKQVDEQIDKFEKHKSMISDAIKESERKEKGLKSLDEYLK